MKKRIIVFQIFALFSMFSWAQLNGPTILVQPVDQTDVCPNNYVQFIVSGLNIDSYQWQESQDGGNSWANILCMYYRRDNSFSRRSQIAESSMAKSAELSLHAEYAKFTI